jgi:hypothetical protein
VGRTPALLLLAAGAAGAQCVTFGPFQMTGRLPMGVPPAGTLTEVSGLEASRQNPGVLWVHDDGAFGSTIVAALRADGALAQLYQLAGVTNTDWEDVALGPGPDPGRDYLWLADTGDNQVVRTGIALIRVAEPDVPAAPGALQVLPGALIFRCVYPDGAHNAETLLFDPLDGAPYLLTKENATTARLYRYPLPLDAGVTKTLVLAGTFGGMPTQLTGGDVAPDGSLVYVRSPTAVRAFPRAGGAPFADAFAAPSCTIAVNAQGNAEGLAVEPDGLGLWATAEGSGAGIWRARGTLPAGRVAFATWFAFGTGLPGAAGVPGLGLDGPPLLGRRPVTVGLWQARPGAAAFLALSLTAFPDGVVPLAGGWAHVALDALFPLACDAGGRAQLPLGVIPDEPALRGLRVHAQAAVADPAAVQGLALTPGLTVVLER